MPIINIDEDLSNAREGIPDKVLRGIERSFKKLWGFPDHILPDTDNEGVPFLTEKNFSQNIKFVIGVECPFFGKMLYLYFADGYDKVKINLAKFIEGLKPYVSDEDRQLHNRTSFKILDFDMDG